jgi:hypothetical protein
VVDNVWANFAVLVIVDITAANTNRSNLDQYLVISRYRDFDILNGDFALLD